MRTGNCDTDMINESTAQITILTVAGFQSRGLHGGGRGGIDAEVVLQRVQVLATELAATER